MKKINKRKAKNKSSITPEFKKWVMDFVKEHDDALRELAKR